MMSEGFSYVPRTQNASNVRVALANCVQTHVLGPKTQAARLDIMRHPRLMLGGSL
jgi:hypothetical protein